MPRAEPPETAADAPEPEEQDAHAPPVSTEAPHEVGDENAQAV